MGLRNMGYSRDLADLDRDIVAVVVDIPEEAAVAEEAVVAETGVVAMEDKKAAFQLGYSDWQWWRVAEDVEVALPFDRHHLKMQNIMSQYSPAHA